MPPKRAASLGIKSTSARVEQKRRKEETEEQRITRLQQDRSRHSSIRARETPLQRQQRRKEDRQIKASRRTRETQEQKQQRQRVDNLRHTHARTAPFTKEPWLRGAFNYDPAHPYALEAVVQIHSMSKLCTHCGALKWDKEPPGMCCSNGKVKLHLIPTPPEPLKGLLLGTNEASKHFLHNIQKYNSAFQMTSFGANIVREAGFMPTFKVQGQVYHRIGSLQPLPDEDPRYLQLYFVGNMMQQAKTRFNKNKDTKYELIMELQEMLHITNSYVKSFKCALEKAPTLDFQILINADKRPSGEHSRRFNAPECNEVAVIMAGEEYNKRDIVLQRRDNNLKRINETHRSYDALQYPLILVNGQDGYHFGISQAGPNSNKTVSCKDFYAYHFMVRQHSFNIFHRSQNLFLQFAVDMYAKVEAERFAYIRAHQKELRVESYIHLRDATNNDVAAGELGKLCILPSSHVGSPRYMHERTQDAMTYVRNYGRPDLFITFTCNPKWMEIQDELFQGQSAMHRHDLTARVFKLKINKLMDLITKANIFGPVRCYMYTIEWQKRGLPHAHILIWLLTKIHASQIDSIISAELPDPSVDKELFNIVKTQMVHGPCGYLNRKSPCMHDGKCSKNYPRPFLKETQTGDDGYPLYRRRMPEDGGHQAVVGKNEIDNRWIVPYCPLLLKIFNAHINVEFCNSVKSIKYVCKYVNKGPDAAMFALQQKQRDEVSEYQQGRYISSNEAFWRIFGFPIHERYPPIQQLAVHLENGQRVYFTAQTAAHMLTSPKETTLTAFFKLSQKDQFARTLYYHQLPSFYTWNNKQWSRRKRGANVDGHPGIKFDSALGRVYTVHPSQHECFFLRLLLHEVKGPTSFEELRTVDGLVCPTYREACLKLGLLENDAQWEATLSEASISKTGNALRALFAILLKTCEISNPRALWDKFRDELAEDYKYQAQCVYPHMEVTFSDEIYNTALVDIENRVITMGGDELPSYGLPQTNRSQENRLATEILRETSYNLANLANYIEQNEPKLLTDQRLAYQTVEESVRNQSGHIFFLDAPGGTGKTFVTNLLLAKVRHQKKLHWL